MPDEAGGALPLPPPAARVRQQLATRVAATPPTVAGAILVILAGAAFVGMHTTIKYLSDSIHPFEIAFFRNLFGLAVMVPYLVGVGRTALYTRRPGLHLVRGLFNAGSMLCWFYALSLITVADATALSLTGQIFVTLGAILFLGEPGTLRRWLGIAIGLSGAFVIVRPGFVDPSLGMALVVVSSACVAVSKLIAKTLLRTESTTSVVAWVTCLMMFAAVVPAAFVWTWPTMTELMLLAGIGALGTCGHLLITSAYKLTDVTIAEPILFTHLIWAALFGLVIFGHFPDVWTWIGGAVIVAGSTWLVRGERRAKSATAPAVPKSAAG